jgi:phosphoglycolate phosphatase
MDNRLKLFIFDCDGTLVDSQEMIVAAMHQAYRAHDLDLPAREAVLGIVGLSLPVAFARLGAGVDGFPVAGLVEEYRAAFFALRSSGRHLEPLYPGARDAVEALAARPGVRLGIATGKSQRGVRAVLRCHGLIDRFHTIKTSDDAPSKPDPGMVLAAMEEAGVGPADTVVIGDTVFDVAMAHAAGCRAIGVTWGYHAADTLAGAGAHAVIEDFAALVPTLETMWDGEAGVFASATPLAPPLPACGERSPAEAQRRRVGGAPPPDVGQ